MRSLKAIDARVSALEKGARPANGVLRPVLSHLTDDELDRLEKAMAALEQAGPESLSDRDLNLIANLEWQPDQVAG